MTNLKHKIEKVWVDDKRVYARTTDGLTASYPFELWERLKNATSEEKKSFFLSYSGIHWPLVDEDLSFVGMFIFSKLCTPDTPEESFYYSDFSSSIDDNEREDIAKANFDYGKEEGRAEGIAEGEAAKAKAIAKKLLAMGLPVEQVAEGTGLSVEEVKALG